MMTLILRMIRDRKTAIIVYGIAGIVLLWMYVALFPSFAETADSMEQFMQNFPEGFMKAFGIEDLSLSTLEKFLATEQFSFVWPLLMLFFVTSIAGTNLAAEVERGTIEILLAQPVSRLKVFWSRYAAGIIMFLIFLIVSVFAVVPLAALHDVAYQLKSYAFVSLMGLLFGLAVFSFATMLSAFFSERSRVYTITGGVLVAMYVFNIVAAINDSFSWLQYFSFFHHFAPNDLLVRHAFDGTSAAVFGGVIVVCTLIGAWRYNQRDLAA